MKKTTIIILLLCSTTTFGIVKKSFADSAEVLPKGVSRLDVTSNLYFPVKKQFNDDGDEEDVAADYNTSLDSRYFPDLALVEAGFGLPAGSGTLGNSIVSFEYEFTDLIFTYQYGLTDKLTLGIYIPYWWQKTKVDARLDSSNATIGRNPLWGQVGDPFGTPLIPIALGGIPLTTEDILTLLTEEYGYKRLGTWSDSGISDIEIGGRYQYYDSEKWRLAFTGGMRLPTGEVDDLDNLVDEAFGDGAYVLIARLNNDYKVSKNLLLNATIGYELPLSYHEQKRILYDANDPITDIKETVEIDPGDSIKFEASGKYEFTKAVSCYILYKYAHKDKDKVTSPIRVRYQSLEDETDVISHIAIVGLSYSTLSLYMEKKFPIPLDFSISYRTRFAGKNIFKSKYIILRFSAYF
jgi:hypothetical protein